VRIPLSDIRTVSQCPAYYSFLKQAHKKPVSVQANITESVIKRAYVNAATTGFRLEWKSIITQVDKEVFKDIDMADDDDRMRGTKTSEHILGFLRQWYHRMYLAEEAVGYADISLTAEVDGYVITATAPIVKLAKGPGIMRISDVVYNKGQLYNDIGMRGLLWFASEALNCKSIAGQHLAIGVQGGIDLSEIQVGNDAHKRTKKAVLQALSLIEAGIDFPSVTEKCNTCPFKRRCRL